MAKKTKLQTKKEKRRAARRSEQRFLSQASTNSNVIRAAGALSAFLLGAGAWANFYAQSFTADEKLKQLPSYMVAAGAVLMGVTIWIGTSSESPIRVGDPGIALEKGELRRMPWWAIDKVSFDPDARALLVTGKDEANVDWTLRLSQKSHVDAIGWIVKESLDRIPRRVEIPEEVLETVPGASEHVGQRLELDALQVVGKRCAITGKTISYEPDARICSRCERVYEKGSVPKKCKCGNSLAHLRPKGASDEGDTTEEDAEEEEAHASPSGKLVSAEET